MCDDSVIPTGQGRTGQDRTGQDRVYSVAAVLCRRATIRAWVAEETSDRALEELLQMNDRLLALVSQWQAVSEELQAQRQHRVGAPGFSVIFWLGTFCTQLRRATILCIMHGLACCSSQLACCNQCVLWVSASFAVTRACVHQLNLFTSVGRVSSHGPQHLCQRPGRIMHRYKPVDPGDYQARCT